MGLGFKVQLVPCSTNVSVNVGSQAFLEVVSGAFGCCFGFKGFSWTVSVSRV